MHRGHIAPDATSFVWRWRVQACSFSVLTPVRPHAITSLPFALCRRSCAQCSVHASLSPCACRQCHTRHPLLAHYPSGCPQCRRTFTNLLHGSVVLYASIDCLGTYNVAVSKTENMLTPESLSYTGHSLARHVTEVIASQSSKAPAPIVVTDSPMLTDAREVQELYLEVIDSQLFAVNTVEK